ncbi:RRM domain-containing protein [Psidium guajava]|nr:RRM domain-containing protein [Psidium guajava]
MASEAVAEGKSLMASMGSSNYSQSHNPQDYAYYGFDDDEIEIDNIPNVEQPIPTQGSMNLPPRSVNNNGTRGVIRFLDMEALYEGAH